MADDSIGLYEQVAAARVRYETQAVIKLAGPAAQLRALQGSRPEWRRMRRPDELRAFHECGHGTAALAFGRRVYRLSIAEDSTIPVGAGHLAGICQHGEPNLVLDKEVELERLRRATVKTDRRSAVETAYVLAMLEPGGPTWRSARRVLGRLRERAAKLVAANWWVVSLLADEVERHRELDQGGIEAILARAGLMPWPVL
jgi:hypothetical protein